MSPISATRTAPRVGPMPGIFCTAVYPGSWASRPRMIPANTLVSKPRSSITWRSEAIRAAYGAGSSSPSNSSVPATPNRSLISTWTPHLASTACTSALQCELKPDQLGPVPDQLTQLPCGRGCDPRLGQASHPQQVRQVLGVANVVLDPAVLKGLDPQRVGQVHVGTTGLQRVHSPVPPVGGLQHHLRALTSPGHHRRQPLHVIDDPHRLEHLTSFGGPDDHSPASVQIDSHILSSCIRFHLGASSPSRAALRYSQSSRWEAPLGAGGGPAPSSHQRPLYGQDAHGHQLVDLVHHADLGSPLPWPEGQVNTSGRVTRCERPSGDLTLQVHPHGRGWLA